jgi:alkanesulfonate monooxygenase SsuD/methylene tetrahydromethanopterin reductase-like flavin-dependent oxidoreductase (luciferase family)
VRGEVPIWLGYQGPKGARRAGRMGVGLLSLVPDLLEPYRQGLAEAGHDPALARMGGVIDLVVADDPPAVMEAVAPHWMHQQNSYREAAVAGTGREAKLLTLEGLRERIATKGSLPGLAVCTPDDAVALIRSRTEGLPVHHVYLWASVAGMPDALAHRHIELLCSRVAPALADDGGTDR